MADVTKLHAANPASCSHGVEIMGYASRRGLQDPRLVYEVPFGWYLVGSGTDGALPSTIADELNISRGGGSAGWHQITPEWFSDPVVRANEMLDDLTQTLESGNLPGSWPWNLCLNQDGVVTTREGFVVRPSDVRSQTLTALLSELIEMGDVPLSTECSFPQPC